MADGSPIFIASPGMFILAMLLVAGIVGIGLWRRIRLPQLPRLLAILGLAALALAMADVKWRNEPNRRVVVMVDQSTSTRGAAFRDETSLNHRIRQLLPGVDPVRVDFNPAREGLTPPLSSAVLLFSDGQIPMPDTAPPTFIAVDPTLESPVDAAVEDMEIRQDSIAIQMSVRGPARSLVITQNSDSVSRDLPPGRYTITLPLAAGAHRITATISAGDLWPENDSMTIRVPPPMLRDRWWIGDGVPQTGWRQMSPAQLPTDAVELLTPAVVVLNNISADELSALQQASLQQYVRDLGGGLVMVGGDRAFAAGHYTGTALEALSPLASTPPSPTTRWILLADSSGSMAQAFDQSTRWFFAASAMKQVAQSLPPFAWVEIGSFAKDVHWWFPGQVAKSVADLPIPAITPSGPTNLEPALIQIAATNNGTSPTELLILTDAETTITNVPSLAASLKSKSIRLHVIATQPLDQSDPLARLATLTGGNVASQSDPHQWATAVQNLARGAMPDEIIREPVRLHFQGPLQSLGSLDVPLWNRTWPKGTSAALASADYMDESYAMSALWHLGAGKVVAAAFPAAAQAEAMAELVASPPRDPRFTVVWRTGSIRVDAIDGDSYLNDLKLSLWLGPTQLAIPQTGPGRYELHFDPPAMPVLARVEHDGRPIDRRALAGRYAREFTAIGNDTAGLKDLAARTGGEWIPPEQTTPIVLPPAADGVSMTPWFAIAGALLIGLALIAWKRMV